MSHSIFDKFKKASQYHLNNSTFQNEADDRTSACLQLEAKNKNDIKIIIDLAIAKTYKKYSSFQFWIICRFFIIWEHITKYAGRVGELIVSA